MFHNLSYQENNSDNVTISKDSINSENNIEGGVADTLPDIDNITNIADASSLLKQLRINNTNNVILAHLNINFIAPKIDALKLVVPNYVDVLIIGETKIDDSFPTSQLLIPSFAEPFRRDRNDSGGGILIYVRDDIPCKLLKKHTFSNDIEGIFLELNFRKSKWLLLGGYRPPSQNKEHFLSNLCSAFDIYTKTYDKLIVCGDFNMEEDDLYLSSFMCAYDFKCLIKDDTCFKSLENPSCIDLILTNCRSSFQNTTTISTGISDFHKMVVTVFKTTFPKCKPQLKKFRSYKKFVLSDFKYELKQKLISKAHVNYKTFYDTFISVLDTHAPIKERLVRANEVPYMTKKLRKAIATRSRLENNYMRLKTVESRNIFRKQRNYCSRLYKQERKKFYENIDVKNFSDTRMFWKLNKPFFSDKGMTKAKITLIDNNEIISDDKKVAESLNTFFESAVKNLQIPTPHEHINENFDNIHDSVDRAIFKYANHPSILKIKEIIPPGNQFSFTKTNPENIANLLKELNHKKAVPSNDIPPNILKKCSDICDIFISNIVNDGIENDVFDANLKLADVTPVFKDLDRTLKSKYRPVSILPVISKISERTLEVQISKYIKNFLSPYLCGYRKGYSTQHAILTLVEKWKEIIDKKGYGGAVLMDLSKAFDTIDHELLIAKLYAYGFSKKSLKLIFSYLSDRWQRTKINSEFSTWSKLLQGVPQGSILGPLLFNIYINDLFFFITETDLCNYADDTTLYAADMSLDNMMNRLEYEIETSVTWFRNNYMKLNGDKCHLIIGGNKKELLTTTIGEHSVKETEKERLLGIQIDRELKFDHHVNIICRKAGKQLNALSRQCKILPFFRRKILLNSYFHSLFQYGRLVWMFHNRVLNAKINSLHFRALRMVYNDSDLTFEELLKKDGSTSVHHQNIKHVAIEMYKIHNNLSPIFMSEILPSTTNAKTNVSYYTRNHNDFYNRINPRTVNKGICSLRHFGPIVWNMVPIEIKQSTNLSLFKDKIEKWEINNCPCRLCKDFIPGLGYVDNVLF